MIPKEGFGEVFKHFSWKITSSQLQLTLYGHVLGIQGKVGLSISYMH
jgi:hypothetical protein